MPITFDKKIGQYRDAKGRFVSDSQVQTQVTKLVNSTEQNFKSFAKDLNSGNINLAEFQIRFADELKTAHSLAASIGIGGRNQMNPSDWALVGSSIKEQYQFLNEFARDIENKRLSPNQLEFRAGLYSKAIHSTFHKFAKRLKGSVGKTMSRRVLHARESCPDCAEWANKGFVPIEEQPAIGALACKVFCLCSLEYQ